MPKHYTGPVPTLGELHRQSKWLWLNCARTGCHHTQPVALAAFVIRWGSEASSDMLRRHARCARCGHIGATLQHPSWSGSVEGGECGFPVERMGG